MLYVHGKQLRSCQKGQILNHTIPEQASLILSGEDVLHPPLTVLIAHSFDRNEQLALPESVEGGNLMEFYVNK